MKATLSFDLPEENEEFKLATNAVHYSLALSDMDNHLRAKLKYEQLGDVEHQIYQEIRDKLHEILHDHEVSV